MQLFDWSTTVIAVKTMSKLETVLEMTAAQQLQ